ncbi:MAG: DUF3108 domain-containing protein [Rhizobium rhizophilum]|uniref:DUF3108 domain-containing protein n=1 Tax=Rhizobium rhizophilum TaxID=1850373 RepID=UPI00391D24D8
MRFTGLALAFLALMPAAAGASDYRYDTSYSVALGILPIARMTFQTEVVSDRYTISGQFHSSGLVDIVREVAAKSTVSGTLTGGRMLPQRYALDYKSGKRASTYEVLFSGGNVVETRVTPDRPKPSSWVPVKPGDLKAVLDPIGALLIPGDVDVCGQTLPVYDGESRMDLVLSPNRSESFSAGSAKGDAIVCSVRYVPKSGYRKGRKDIEYLTSVTGMEIWFAKTATLKLYAPVYAKIPTRYGTVHVTAEKFDG